MKYLTILLVLSLAMCAMANDFDEIRELQALTGGVKVGGKAKVGVKAPKVAAKGSVKAKVAAPKVKAKVGVKVPKVKAKIGVKAPKVGVKVGGAAKAGAKVGGKVKVGIKAPKVGLKVGGKTGAKAKVGGKVKIGLKVPKVKIGGHFGLKVGGGVKAKAAVKTQAKVYTGTCPYAAKFGMTQVKAYAHTNKSVCKSLESTCCDAKSMTDYQTGFRKWTKSLSKTMWTLLRIPTMAGVIMGNLKVDKCAAGAAPAKKDDKKPATPAKKDDKKPAAPAKKNRLLQALKAKASVKPKAKVSVKAKVPKVKAGLKIGGKAKVGGKLKIGGKAKAGGKVKVGLKVPKVKAGLKIGGGLKVGGKLRIKHKLKLKVKAKGFQWKANAHFENKVAPKDFLKGQACQASFTAAYQALYNVNHNRKQVQYYGKRCFLALVRLRGELSCAACDNTQEKFFKDSKKLNIKQADVADLGFCVGFMSNFNKYKGQE